MAKRGRNAPCPCGSGRKHKQCCLDGTLAERQHSRMAERLWERLQGWTIAEHPEHLDRALDELFGDERRLTPEQVDLLCSYAHLDRGLDGGKTPAERFAELPGLSDAERATARTLSEARLGLWRVRAVEPGASMKLEEILGGRTLEVRSDRVSQATVRWDVLLGRVVAGAVRHELWGPAAIFSASEEEELVAEVRRLAVDRSTTPAVAFRACAAELLFFLPASRSTPPSFYTFEGDEVMAAHARWELEAEEDVAALEHHPDLVETADTDDGEGICLEWTLPRRELAARRPELPAGAVLLESTPVFVDPVERRASGDGSRIGLGTFELRPRELTFDAISSQRLEGAIALVADAIGNRARLVERQVRPLETSGSRGHGSPGGEISVPEAMSEAIIAAFARDRFMRKLDEPSREFDGLTPREAASSAAQRPRLERWLRTLENGAAHSDSTAPDVAAIRTELGMPDEDLADAA